MDNSIFIPKKIKVGFQTRKDTYTGKLAYVIYYDQKGKLRKAASWESWRDSKIEPEEYDNTPTEGFVLNKKVGGYKTHWDARQTYVRVFDPRGFEFEITIPNLLYILENTSSIKGKGLEGEFVYGWSGTELVLLPTCAPEYQELQELNRKRFEQKPLKPSEFRPGYEYTTKSNKKLIYMGRFDAYADVYHFDGKVFVKAGDLEKYAREHEMPLGKEPRNTMWGYNKYSVYGSTDRLYTYGPGCIGLQYFFAERGDSIVWFSYMKSPSGKFIESSDDPVPDFADIFDKLEHQVCYSPIDHSKDELHLLSKDDFDNRVDSRNFYSASFYTQIKDKIVEYRIWAHDGGYTCEIPRSDNLILRKLFKFITHPFRCDVMVPVSADEIFEKLPPVYIDQYLTNGKYFRRVYNGSYE